MIQSKRFLPALLAAGLLFLPSAVRAHFVWLEPGPAPDGEARLYFGEYPALREGAPLLEKVQRTRVYALDGKTRRELKQARGGDHYRYEGGANAPMVIAHLDYGILEREGTPPFFLRYEAQLLRGDGKPLPLAQVARLSALRTELPLAVAFKPLEGGRLGLEVTLEGKAAQAEVAHAGPGETELRKEKTDPRGRLELPLSGGGWHHFRISAEDGKPVTFEGKEGKFTRTYLSLTFNLQEGPKATAPAAARTAAPDPDAVKALSDAHEARANWGAAFPGFTADAVYSLNGRETRGKITVDPAFKITYDLGDRELENAIRPSFTSLVMHRQGGNPRYQATWRDAATHPLGRAINLNDEYGSWYRVRDRQILQVNRTMGSQRFINNVLENETTKLGFLPRAWTVSYYDNDTNALLRVSTTRVTWAWLGDVFVPATVETVNAHGEGTDVSRLVLSNPRLLK